MFAIGYTCTILSSRLSILKTDCLFAVICTNDLSKYWAIREPSSVIEGICGGLTGLDFGV